MTAISEPLVTPVSPDRLERALVLLHRELGTSKLLTTRDACEGYARDDSEARGDVLPSAVVLAETWQDVQRVLWVAEQTGVPVTPRGGGTGRVGGAVPVAGGIVLTLLGMNQIKEIDRQELLAVVEPGVILSDLHAAVEAEGLFYPPDPNSLLGCALGGNVATNAGGPRAFKYGSTKNYVLGLETALIGGQCFFAGRRTPKGVTGYDVTGLLVGSEGTLGVFGDVTLRLVPKPESVMTLVALFSDVRHAVRCVQATIAHGIVPRCIELLDQGTLQALRAMGNPISERACALLLMEVDGSERDVERQAERIGDVCDEVQALELLAAQDAGQRDRLWKARREMSPAVKRMAKYKLSEDVVVPRRAIAELLDRVSRSSEELALRTVAYGHAGDGNLHVNFLWDDDSELPKVARAVEQLFRDVVSLRGTLSGEHGIGILKAPYLHLEQSRELIELQQAIKQVFDPKGLLNPGKIFNASGAHGPC